eukprot:Pgem_evm2s555
MSSGEENKEVFESGGPFQIKHIVSGLCVSDNGTTTSIAQNVSLKSCNAQDKDQIFRYNKNKQQITSFENGELCLDDQGRNTDDPMRFYNCQDGNANQQFLYRSQDKAIQSLHKKTSDGIEMCLSNLGGMTEASSLQMQIQRCYPHDDTQTFDIISKNICEISEKPMNCKETEAINNNNDCVCKKCFEYDQDNCGMYDLEDCTKCKECTAIDGCNETSNIFGKCICRTSNCNSLKFCDEFDTKCYCNKPSLTFGMNYLRGVKRYFDPDKKYKDFWRYEAQVGWKKTEEEQIEERIVHSIEEKIDDYVILFDEDGGYLTYNNACIIHVDQKVEGELPVHDIHDYIFVGANCKAGIWKDNINENPLFGNGEQQLVPGPGFYRITTVNNASTFMCKPNDVKDELEATAEDCRKNHQAILWRRKGGYKKEGDYEIIKPNEKLNLSKVGIDSLYVPRFLYLRMKTHSNSAWLYMYGATYNGDTQNSAVTIYSEDNSRDWDNVKELECYYIEDLFKDNLIYKQICCGIRPNPDNPDSVEFEKLCNDIGFNSESNTCEAVTRSYCNVRGWDYEECGQEAAQNPTVYRDDVLQWCKHNNFEPKSVCACFDQPGFEIEKEKLNSLLEEYNLNTDFFNWSIECDYPLCLKAENSRSYDILDRPCYRDNNIQICVNNIRNVIGGVVDISCNNYLVKDGGSGSGGISTSTGVIDTGSGSSVIDGVVNDKLPLEFVITQLKQYNLDYNGYQILVDGLFETTSGHRPKIGSMVVFAGYREIETDIKTNPLFFKETYGLTTYQWNESNWERSITPQLSLGDGLNLKPTRIGCSVCRPTPVRSLRERHILAISDLVTLPADFPILNIITIPDAINVATHYLSIMAW